MVKMNELETFLAAWEQEAQHTISVLEALPPDQYDFRADPKGRSIGEMAWHLAELDGHLSSGIVERRFSFEGTLPELKRPREVKLLAPGFRRVHELALERLRGLKVEALDEKVMFFDGTPMTIRDVLWTALLHHLIHHRAQLVLMTRLAGGVPPGLYGPNREQMEAMKKEMQAAKK